MSKTLPPYRQSWQDRVESLGVSPEQGLADSEVRKRLQRYGPNQLHQRAAKSAWGILASQFKSVVVVLLVGAGAVALALGDWTEAAAILAVIAVNAAIGFVTEVKATRSMEALHKLGSVNTRVRRDGQVKEVPADELVPGDIVILEGGDIVTADLRVIEVSKLQCDESALTGESAPVSKQTEALPEDAPLADRRNMLYKGTAVTRGSATAIVVATGMETELGQISSLVEEAQEETTPLEEHLNALGGSLVWVVLGITGAVWLMGVLRGKDVFLMLETAIALAVASIPEGLPIVATIALSRGMLRMARRQALVRRLASVETLGSTNIICTDKTGTLTENKMTVARVEFAGGRAERSEGKWLYSDGHAVSWEEESPVREAFKIGVLCNNALIRQEESGGLQMAGDPLETSLLEAGLEAGLDRNHLLEHFPEVKEDAFDSESKRMATYHQNGDGYQVAVKGAPEAILADSGFLLTTEGEKELTAEVRQEWLERNEQMAREGFRVLAVGRKRVQTLEDNPYEGLVLVGLLGMVDPPRSDIRSTLDRCHRAGIRVVMVTGDQAETALNIATAVGIVGRGEATVVHGGDLKPISELSDEEKTRLRNAAVFARVSPRQKLDLIALHQAAGSVVAMTGDGVNDAPALKKADIGIAMGKRGTQVAQQAADVVLKDDFFKTIVYAIQEGRIIFGNIRNFVVYLLSCNIAEVLLIFLAALINTPLPILPLQILLLNLVTDVFPALALGAGEGNEGVMKHPPRPSGESILKRSHWQWITFYGVVLGLCTLGAFLVAHYALGMGLEESVTVCFLALAFSQLFHVFNMREAGADLFGNAVTRNPYVWGALALCTGILLTVVYIPALAKVLHTTPLDLQGWLIVLPASVAPVGIDVLVRAVRHRDAPPAQAA